MPPTDPSIPRGQLADTIAAALRRSREVTLHLERALADVRGDGFHPSAQARVETHLTHVYTKTHQTKQATTRAFGFIERIRTLARTAYPIEEHTAE